MKPNIELNEDCLKFSFPEITQQLNMLLDQHMQQLPPALRLPDDRRKLVDAVIELTQGSEWLFRPHKDDHYELRKSIEATARSLTASDVEKALRSVV